jgi:hypothetical protein
MLRFKLLLYLQEMDCVRVISEYNHELIQKVPVEVEKIFRINSTAPGSYLVEASKQFQVTFYIPLAPFTSTVHFFQNL